MLAGRALLEILAHPLRAALLPAMIRRGWVRKNLDIEKAVGCDWDPLVKRISFIAGCTSDCGTKSPVTVFILSPQAGQHLIDCCAGRDVFSPC